LTLRKVGAQFGPIVSQLSTQHKFYNITGDVLVYIYRKHLQKRIIQIDIEE